MFTASLRPTMLYNGKFKASFGPIMRHFLKSNNNKTVTNTLVVIENYVPVIASFFSCQNNLKLFCYSAYVPSTRIIFGYKFSKRKIIFFSVKIILKIYPSRFCIQKGFNNCKTQCCDQLQSSDYYDSMKLSHVISLPAYFQASTTEIKLSKFTAWRPLHMNWLDQTGSKVLCILKAYPPFSELCS